MATTIRRCITLFAAAAAAAAMSVATSGQALAYGSADQPLAQVALSANCDNPAFPLCQQVGLGGIWLWVEIDTGGSADVAGAECGHDRAGSGGAGSIKGEFDWTSFSGSPDQFAAAYPDGFLFGVDPNASYYVLLPFGFGFPTTVGHYSLHPAPGVSIQLQIAP